MFSFITKPIGCLFSFVGSLVVIALVLVVASLGLVAYFMPQIGAKAITETTGFPTSVGSSSLSLWHQRLLLKDIRINNPEEYPEDDFLAISSLSVTLDRRASEKGHLVFNEGVLDIDTITLVRLSGAVLNGSTIIRNLMNSKLSADPAAYGAAGGQAQGGFAQSNATPGSSAQGGHYGASGTNPFSGQTTPAGQTGSGSWAQPGGATGGGVPAGGALPAGSGQTQAGGRGQAAPGGSYPAAATQGYPSSGQSGAIIRFDPIQPPPPLDIPPVASAPATYAATDAASGGAKPPWLIRRLTVRIGGARLFESTPQGNFLQLLPLQYERTFDNVTTLRQVLPTVVMDLARRGLPL